jgi:cobalt-zinc-cadmium efflux system outer membrane protein
MLRFRVADFSIRFNSVAIGLLLASASVSASPQNIGQPGDSVTLDQVIQDVVRNNDRLAAARYMEEATRAKIGSAGTWDDPMLMLGVTGLPTSFDFAMEDMTMKMIGLSQRIPYAGEKGLQTKAAQSEALASTEERRSMELDLVTAAKFAFFDAYYREKSLADIQRQRGLQEQVVQSTLSRLESGQGSQDEVLTAQADLWRLESSILSVESQVFAARQQLNSLRGVESDSTNKSLAAPTVVVPGTPDKWLADAQGHYPPLLKLKQQSESYAYSAAASRRMRWPMLDLSADYGFRADGPMGPRDDMLGFRATLSLPLFSRRQQGSMAGSMEAMRQSADAEAQQVWRDVRSDLLSLHDRSQRLSQSLALYRERIIPAAEDACQAAIAGYTSNRIALTTVLNYTAAIYRDRITLNELANELARTLAQAEKYTADLAQWDLPDSVSLPAK